MLFSGFLSAELGGCPYLEHTSMSSSGLSETLSTLAGKETISQKSTPWWLKKRGQKREGGKSGQGGTGTSSQWDGTPKQSPKKAVSKFTGGAEEVRPISVSKKEDLAGIYLATRPQVQKRQQTLSKGNARTGCEIASISVLSQEKEQKNWGRQE